MEGDSNAKIFEAICHLVVKADFLTKQNDFFKENYTTFDGEEENKLEHTEVFNKYIALMDTDIDQKLNVDYSEDQQKAFLLDFKDNTAKYKEINKPVVDQLFGFVDFSEFKLRISEYKKMMDMMQKPNTAGDEAFLAELKKYPGDDDLFKMVMAEDVNDTKIWMKQMEMDTGDMTLESWVRPVAEGSSLQIGKSVGRMKKCNYKAFNWIFDNVEEYIKMGEMTSMTKELKVIENSESRNRYFMSMNFGQPADVEMLMEQVRIKHSDKE